MVKTEKETRVLGEKNALTDRNRGRKTSPRLSNPPVVATVAQPSEFSRIDDRAL